MRRKPQEKNPVGAGHLEEGLVEMGAQEMEALFDLGYGRPRGTMSRPLMT